MLEIRTEWGDTEKVQLIINSYANNHSMYIGLVSMEDEFSDLYADVTVNLNGEPPNYCAYVNVADLPEAESFIAENELGCFTGLMKESGFNIYPLYLFDPEKLRELCPEGLAGYEKENGLEKTAEKKDKAR